LVLVLVLGNTIKTIYGIVRLIAGGILSPKK
jgi:hypothetical protein